VAQTLSSGNGDSRRIDGHRSTSLIEKPAIPHRETSDDERLGLGPDRIGHVDDPGVKEGEGYVAPKPLLEGADSSRWRAAHHRVPRISKRSRCQNRRSTRSRIRPAGRTGVVEEPSDAGHVLVVFPQQHGEHPLWRNQVEEPLLIVRDCEDRLAVPDGLPRGDSLSTPGPTRGGDGSINSRTDWSPGDAISSSIRMSPTSRPRSVTATPARCRRTRTRGSGAHLPRSPRALPPRRGWPRALLPFGTRPPRARPSPPSPSPSP
jgi:hypothetical protein